MKPGPPQEREDTIEIVNFGAIWNYLKLGRAAARRQPRTIVVFSIVLAALGYVLGTALPKKYHVESRLLAQRSLILRSRSDEQSAPDPAQTAASQILATENVANLVRETDLLKAHESRRNWVQSLKDRILPPSGSVEERTKRLVEYVQSRLSAWNADRVIVIEINWPDPEMAYELVDAAQRSYLETRHVQEVSAFTESLSILESHAAELSLEVENSLKNLKALRMRKLGIKGEDGKSDAKSETNVPKTSESVPSSPSASSPSAPSSPAPEEQDPVTVAAREKRLAELGVVIESKQRVVDELEGYRRRRLSDLQSKLESQRAVFTEAHPEILDLKQAIGVASRESPQVLQVQEELKSARAEYDKLSTAAGVKTAPSSGFSAARRGRATSEAAKVSTELTRDQERDPEIEYARSRLDFAVEKYHGIREQIRLTKVDLDTAQAGFKYRYKVVMPPERPRGSKGFPPALLAIVAAVLGGLIGFLVTFLRELREGRVRETWQVEQSLGLPVLAELRLPASREEP